MKNSHIIKNSIAFTNVVKNIKMQTKLQISSLGILNLYTNIPVHKKVGILRNCLVDANTLSSETINELMNSMVRFLNYFENTYLLSNSNNLKYKIVHYPLYVDDTFIIFYGTLKQIELYCINNNINLL